MIGTEEGVDIGEDGSSNRLNLKCYYCQKKGHSITQCTKLKSVLQGKGKGDGGKGAGGSKGGKDKGKGIGSKGENGKTGPKGGCFHCGGDHFKSDCPKMGKGQSAGKAFALSAIKQVEAGEGASRARMDGAFESRRSQLAEKTS